jgi:hypothetical protein
MYIYKVIDNNNNVLYIGKTVNVHQRMSQHKTSKWWLKKVDIKVAEVPNKALMDIYEIYYINKFNPPFNIKDSRSDIVTGIGLIELKFNKSYKEFIQSKIKEYNILNNEKKEYKNNKLTNMDKFRTQFNVYHQEFIQQIDYICNQIKIYGATLGDFPKFSRTDDSTYIFIKINNLGLNRFSFSGDFGYFSGGTNYISFSTYDEDNNIILSGLDYKKVVNSDIDYIEYNFAKIDKQLNLCSLKEYFISKIYETTGIDMEMIIKFEKETINKKKVACIKRYRYLEELLENNKKISGIFIPADKSKAKRRLCIRINDLLSGMNGYNSFTLGNGCFIRSNKSEFQVVTETDFSNFIPLLHIFSNYKPNFDAYIFEEEYVYAIVDLANKIALSNNNIEYNYLYSGL